MLDISGLQHDSTSPSLSDWDLPSPPVESESPSLPDLTPLPDSSSVLCAICRKSLVSIHEVALITRRKRRRALPPPFLSSMSICPTCLQKDPNDLKTADSKSKRVIKRQKTKIRLEENESEAVKMLKEQRELLLKETNDETELKKLQVVLRNRISAQQSRDRKKLLLSHIETVNTELTEENLKLRRKIEELNGENRYLRGQLERFMMESGGNSGSGMMMLGLGAVLMVVMTVYSAWETPIIPTSHSSRVLSPSTTLMEYKPPQSYQILPPTAIS